MRTLSIFSMVFFVFILNVSSVNAEDEQSPLVISDVAAFLDSTELLWPIAKEMEAEEGRHFFEITPLDLAHDAVPSHVKAMEKLKSENPEYYERVQEAITGRMYKEKKRFLTVEEWAKAADRIYTTYLTSRGDGGDRSFEEMAEKLEPLRQMSKMTPESTVRMQGVLDMVESFTKITDDDRVVVRQFHTQLTFHFKNYPIR